MITKSKTIEETEDLIIAKRYSRIQRTQHWGNVILMIILFLTGLEIYSGIYVGGAKFTQTIHIWAGLLVFILSWIIYTFIIIGERKITEIIPSPRDFLDVVLIMGCAFGILSDEKYPHYDFYDAEKGKYINKYHPTQKFLATINYIMLFFIAMSGFALYGYIAPGNWTFFANIGDWFMTPLINWGIPIRFFHFLVFAYFLMSTMIHFYFTMLPQNRERLRGMATGTQKIPKAH